MTKTEAQTRKDIIDVQLCAAGWDVNDRTQVVEEFDIEVGLLEGVREPRTNYEGHQFSDYVLLGKDGKPLAVVEAKKTTKDAAIGREQAKQYCYSIQKQNGGELPLSINIVAQEGTLIRQAQTQHYWNTATDDELDHLADKLAPLMTFREKAIPPTGPAKFNFAETLHTKEMVEFGPQHEAMSTAKYRELVEQTIMELTKNNPVLQKIKAGETISQSETETLADLLHAEHPHITEALLRKVYQNRKARFIQFIRHILGIEILESYPETVSKAFSDFIQEHTNLSAKQLEFLSLLRDYIIERGEIHKRNLIEAPFTVIHPHGIRGLFTPAEIDEILDLTERLAA